MCAADGLAPNSLCRIPHSPSSCPRDLLLKRLAACPSGSSQLAVACSPWGCGFFIFFPCSSFPMNWFWRLGQVPIVWMRQWRQCWLFITPAASVLRPGSLGLHCCSAGVVGSGLSSPPPSTFWLVPPGLQAFPPQAFAAPRSPFTDGFSSPGTCLLAP